MNPLILSLLGNWIWSKVNSVYIGLDGGCVNVVKTFIFTIEFKDTGTFNGLLKQSYNFDEYGHSKSFTGKFILSPDKTSI